MKNYRVNSKIINLFLFCLVSTLAANAQTTLFSHSGKLPNEITPATGTFEFEVRLFDAATGGTQIGATNSIAAVEVKTRAFTVNLDFGAAAFSGANRFLEIRVRRAGSSEPFTVTAPRIQILSVPYAIRALNATNLDGFDASNFVQTDDPRLSDSRDPNPGSSNYIQNTTSPQAGANFNVSGDGTIGGNLTINGSFNANTLNAATQFNLGGQRILSGTSNTLAVGAQAGLSNTTGGNNSFVGNGAGRNNTIGSFNSFFGQSAGFANTTGTQNSFFGSGSGASNTSSNYNSFFGTLTGSSNTTGTSNSFFGTQSGGLNQTGSANAFFGAFTGAFNTASNNSFFGYASGTANTGGNNNAFFGNVSGNANTTGTSNSFFGAQSGGANTVGNNNSFFGRSAGIATTTGTSNAFFGAQSGGGNVSGFANTLLGTNAEVTAPDLQFATAIGANSSVSTSNTIVLGRSGGQDTVRIPGALDIAGTFGANVLNAATQYNIGNLRVLSNAGTFNLFAGIGAGRDNTTGQQNSFFGAQAGQSNTTGIANSFFGWFAGNENTEGSFNSFFGNSAGRRVTSSGTSANSFFGGGTAINTTTGARNSVFGASAGNNNITGNYITLIGYNAEVASGDLQFATAIGANAVVSTDNTVVLGRTQDTVRVPGLLSVNLLGAAGSANLCRNALEQISTCSSSLRYKSDIQNFTGGLDIIRRLRPISFLWKDGALVRDVGFGAEDVFKIEPLLTTRNASGEIEGVKYAQITTALVNAVNEQQAQIEQLEQQNQLLLEQLKQQQRQTDALKRLVCLSNSNAEVCK